MSGDHIQFEIKLHLDIIMTNGFFWFLFILCLSNLEKLFLGHTFCCKLIIYANKNLWHTEFLSTNLSTAKPPVYSSF